MFYFDDEKQKDKNIQIQEPGRIFYLLMLLFIVIVPLFCF